MKVCSRAAERAQSACSQDEESQDDEGGEADGEPMEDGGQQARARGLSVALPSFISAAAAQVWRGGPLDAGEELECDLSAYDCLHAFQLEWPCLRRVRRSGRERRLTSHVAPQL